MTQSHLLTWLVVLTAKLLQHLKHALAVAQPPNGSCHVLVLVLQLVLAVLLPVDDDVEPATEGHGLECVDQAAAGCTNRHAS